MKITAIRGRHRGDAQAYIFYYFSIPPRSLFLITFSYRKVCQVYYPFYLTPWGFWGYPEGEGSALHSRHLCPRRTVLVVDGSVREPRVPPGFY